MNRLILSLAAFGSFATALPAMTAAANAQSLGPREARPQQRIYPAVQGAQYKARVR